MASSTAVWGIDIGQCALKAMRCTLADDGTTLVPDAFDFIEYPKILTEPDANPEQLVNDALKQFLDDNSVREAKVAISVSGQSGLSRFIKLPPVESKKIPDIVKYEARQQIPFSLEDVIWDYQPLMGGMQDEGVSLETEVGLFAMKRDQVFRALRPFRDAGIELDVVQLTPIAIYNAVVYGVLKDLPDPVDYDPENPPETVAVISMGTDTTDLVVTNGFRIWQRSIPIGGSHFTKQLMKEMKLTFAKAEHLKRHARQASDPKVVFQAMRPVFNDFVQELQRSLGFFRSIDRRAKIVKCVALGNAMLLPGLQPYIEKNLEMPVQKVDEYRHLENSAITTAPKFKENLLSFAVAYGLCIQALDQGRLATNLIPRELVTARLIRRKKPWALMALTVFLVGLGFNYLFNWSRWSEAHVDNYASLSTQVTSVANQSSTLISEDAELLTEFKRLKKLGDEVVSGADSRFLVLELFKVINASLPEPAGGIDPSAVSKVPYHQRTEIYVESIDSQYFSMLTNYFEPNGMDNYQEGFLKDLALAKSDSTSGPTSNNEGKGEEELEEEIDPLDEEAVPTLDFEPPDLSGPGWVIQIKGFHFHTGGINAMERQYVTKTMMDFLENGSIELPAGPGEPLTEFTTKELGIYYPLIVQEQREVPILVPDLDADPEDFRRNASRDRGSEYGSKNASGPLVPRSAYKFTLQFIWIETPASKRMEARKNQQTVDTTGDVVSAQPASS